MSFSTMLIINLSVLASVLISDVGTRRVTWHRLARPLLVSAVIVPLFVKTVSTTGSDLLLQLAGAAAGILIGLIAVSRMTVEHAGPDRTPVTRAGFGYAAVWTAVVAARTAFSYGAQHWFSGWLHNEAISLQFTANGVTNMLVFMAIAAVLTRTLVVLARVNRDRVATSGAPIPVHGSTRQAQLAA